MEFDARSTTHGEFFFYFQKICIKNRQRPRGTLFYSEFFLRDFVIELKLSRIQGKIRKISQKVQLTDL